MRVFQYLDSGKGISDMYAIYCEVQKLKPYAIALYKTWWEDALDAAYFHILENYDADKGSLENYATKVVSTICLNRYRKEVASSDQTILTLDLQKVDEFGIPEEVLMGEDRGSDIRACIIDLIPYFIKDFKFFVSSSVKDRKLNYKYIFNKYSCSVVEEAKDILVNFYAKKLAVMIAYSKSVTLKNFSDDRYTKSFDSGLKYKCELNNIVIVERFKGSHAKKLFRFHIKEYVDYLVERFYLLEGKSKVCIEGIDIYVTISGMIVVGIDNLRASLECELVGSILSRSSLKVIRYDKGEEILFSNTKDEQSDILLPMFGSDITIGFERVVSKEVSKC